MKIKPSTYIIDPLFPTREVHIVAGASGAGKSTLLAQIADQLIKGEDVFGYTPNKINGIAYLAFDRKLAAMGRTFERSLQASETPFPFYSTIDSPEFSDQSHREPLGAIKHLKELHPEVDLLIVDGIGVAFKGDSSRLSEVAAFIHTILRALTNMPSDLTIFAIHHMSKTKKGNEYSSARAKLHGSVAWAATAETVILIEPENENDPENPNRLITICPRNAPERQYTYCYDEYGRLVPGAKLQDPSAQRKEEFYTIIARLPEGSYTTEILRELSDPFAISQATFKRWLKDLVEQETVLIKGRSRGTYLRPSRTVN